MKEYPKIETLWDRDEKTFKVKIGEYRLPEFEYLANLEWVFTEKIDGTNIRVMWDGTIITFGGKTDNAQMPLFLLKKLQELFPTSKFVELYPGSDHAMCLYGEGYGAKIQKGGGNYIRDGVNFILIDIKIGEWWLKREDVEDIATKLTINTVPIIGTGTLMQASSKAKDGFNSTFGSFPAEGIVMRPRVDLFSRNGQRIIAKIKTKDFGSG